MRIQCLTERYFLKLLANALLAISLFYSVGVSAVGIACDPNDRISNDTCPTGNCLRVTGSCSVFNDLCVDGVGGEFDDLNFYARKLCNAICTSTTGECETNVIRCNDDRNCDLREICHDGFCTVGECLMDSDCSVNETCSRNTCQPPPLPPPPPPPPPECSIDTDCEANELCFSGQCVLGNCRGDFECRTNETCIGRQCTSRCPEGQTWVPNPIGFPPIPLGRCQSSDSLIGCCFDGSLANPHCREGIPGCPVGAICSSISVCYSICGNGPCTDMLPRLPRDMPSPDEWLEIFSRSRSNNQTH